MNALFSFQEPLSLGVGLAGFGLAWLFVAAILSVVLPAKHGSRERRRKHSGTSPKRNRPVLRCIV